jgi:tRNA modification GTPase
MRISCRTGAGVSRLRLGLGRRLLPRPGEGISAGEHELEALRSCRDALHRAVDSTDAEIAALEIRAALDMLSQVDMPIPSDAILDRVFQRFCVGK